jgi:argininosuccinate lyase
VFDAVDTLLLVLPAMAGMIATMRVDVDRLATTAADGFALATDVAEHLVRRGVPFRDAHEAVGHFVVWCAVNECDMDEVSDDDLATISEHLTPDVRDVLSVSGALAARSALGGTAPARVREQLDEVARTVTDQEKWAGNG